MSDVAGPKGPEEQTASEPEPGGSTLQQGGTDEPLDSAVETPQQEPSPSDVDDDSAPVASAQKTKSPINPVDMAALSKTLAAMDQPRIAALNKAILGGLANTPNIPGLGKRNSKLLLDILNKAGTKPFDEATMQAISKMGTKPFTAAMNQIVLGTMKPSSGLTDAVRKLQAQNKALTFDVGRLNLPQVPDSVVVRDYVRPELQIQKRIVEQQQEQTTVMERMAEALDGLDRRAASLEEVRRKTRWMPWVMMIAAVAGAILALVFGIQGCSSGSSAKTPPVVTPTATVPATASSLSPR